MCGGEFAGVNSPPLSDLEKCVALMTVGFQHCTFGYHARMPVFTNFNLQFSPGLTVLLGPNGAGKSTLLSLAASVQTPQQGSVSLGDLNSTDRWTRRDYRRTVGWLPQNVAAVPGLRVREQVAYAGWLKGMSRADAWDRSERALRQVDLSSLAEKSAATLSGGQLRRVGIAQALVHDARLILMDEPTAGLDPQQRKTFRAVLSGLPEGIDVVVSTHQTEDLFESYQWVVVLDRARVRFQGSAAEFFGLANDHTTLSRRAEEAYLRFVGAES
jgi:ABC-2 type transport system ATP-binding protein